MASSTSWKPTSAPGSLEWRSKRPSSNADAHHPSFSQLLGNPAFEDLQVVIQEEQLHAEPEPAASLPMRASKVVLYTLSEFVRNKIDRWSAEEAAQARLLLLVPPGQVSTGRLLVEAMYMDAPDLSHLGLGELLALLALADSYCVPKAAAFAAEAVTRATAGGHLAWQDVAALLSLPCTCLHLPACHDIQQMAVEQLRQQLGDLEAVWLDSDKTQRFLSLPHAGLQHLLEGGATAVTSEDTAVYSVGRWLETHPGTPQGQVDALVQLLRLPHCTPNYLAGIVATPGHWLHGSSVSKRDLALAACLATTCTETMYDEGRHQCDGPYYEEGEGCAMDWPPRQLPSSAWMQLHPAWSRCPRMISAITSLPLSWDVPLSRVQQLHGKAQQERVHQLAVCSEIRIWQGRSFALALGVNTGGSTLEVMVQQPEGQLSAVEVEVSVVRSAQRSGTVRCGQHSGQWTRCVDGSSGCVGLLKVVEHDPDTSWQQVQQLLTGLCYIHQLENGQRVLQLRGQVARVA